MFIINNKKYMYKNKDKYFYYIKNSKGVAAKKPEKMISLKDFCDTYAERGVGITEEGKKILMSGNKVSDANGAFLAPEDVTTIEMNLDFSDCENFKEMFMSIDDLKAVKVKQAFAPQKAQTLESMFIDLPEVTSINLANIVMAKKHDPEYGGPNDCLRQVIDRVPKLKHLVLSESILKDESFSFRVFFGSNTIYSDNDLHIYVPDALKEEIKLKFLVEKGEFIMSGPEENKIKGYSELPEELRNMTAWFVETIDE